VSLCLSPPYRPGKTRMSTRRQSGQDTDKGQTPIRKRRCSGQNTDEGKTPMRARRPSREDAEKGLTPFRARQRSEQETPIRARNRPGRDADQGPGCCLLVSLTGEQGWAEATPFSAVHYMVSPCFIADRNMSQDNRRNVNFLAFALSRIGSSENLFLQDRFANFENLFI
jgi:hypothetical protein